MLAFLGMAVMVAAIVSVPTWFVIRWGFTMLSTTSKIELTVLLSFSISCAGGVINHVLF